MRRLFIEQEFLPYFWLNKIWLGAAVLCPFLSCSSLDSRTGFISETQMKQDAQRALAYPKPDGHFTGFDSINLHEVLQVKRNSAVRVKLKLAGKPVPAQLTDGTIVVAGFTEPPAYAKSCISIQRSTDNGNTFNEPKLFEDMPGRVSGFKLLKSGALILAHGDDRISRSTDGGKTWSTFTIPNDLIPGEGGLVLGECLGPIELPDGTLMMHLARNVGYYLWTAFVIRSTDDGRTWGDPTQVPTGTDADEISYVLLSSGRILGIGRSSGAFIKRNGYEDVVPGGKNAPVNTEAGDSPAMFHSDDLGRTWSKPKPTGLGVLQAAGAFPLELPDGRVILTYGNRQFPFGAQAVASRDAGQTWDTKNPVLLSWFSWSGYCGHPRSVLLQDGSILTGYYTQWQHRNDGGGDHNADCTGELVRWRVPDEWPG